MSMETKAFRLPYGESNFEYLRENDYIYVDKTRFIEKLEYEKKVIYLRPRRFGKSLFLSMLSCFYDVEKHDKFDMLFKGLDIYENTTTPHNHLYVMHFDFSGIPTKNMDVIEAGFAGIVKTSIENFAFKYGFDIELKRDDKPSAMLNQILSLVENKEERCSVCILIDEYDHFTNAVLENGMSDFLTLVKRGGMVRSFYEIIKKFYGTGLIERYFITGVMPVSLDSMTSGFNISRNLTTDAKFAQMMGFTKDEVKTVLNLPFKFNQNDVIKLNEDEQHRLFDVFRENYNGYLFSPKSQNRVFNSTLIIYYFSEFFPHKISPDYLVDVNLNQSANTITTLLNIANADDNYRVIEELIEHKEIIGSLSRTLDIVKKYDRDDFITLMFNIGLLTIKESRMRTIFEIPNKVIESLYLSYLSDILQRRFEVKIDKNKQALAIEEMGFDGKLNQMTALVENFLAHISYRNAVKFDEKYIKLIYRINLDSSNQYSVFDELELGGGYADLVVLKTPASVAKYEFLIELKYLKKSEATPEKIQAEFEAGVKQIKQYASDKRMTSRSHLKKFVIVFVGYEAVRMEEVKEESEGI